MASEVEVAWAAGLFEGEGCITMNAGTTKLRLALGSTDEDVVRRFAAIVGCGFVNGPYKIKGGKDQWRWGCATRGTLAVLPMFLPYLGERRRARAAEIMAERDALMRARVAPRPCAYCRGSFSPSPRAGKVPLYCSKRCCWRASAAAKRERLLGVGA